MTVLGNFCTLRNDASKGCHTVIVPEPEHVCSTQVQVLNVIFEGTKHVIKSIYIYAKRELKKFLNGQFGHETLLKAEFDKHIEFKN